MDTQDTTGNNNVEQLEVVVRKLRKQAGLRIPLHQHQLFCPTSLRSFTILLTREDHTRPPLHPTSVGAASASERFHDFSSPLLVRLNLVIAM